MLSNNSRKFNSTHALLITEVFWVVLLKLCAAYTKYDNIISQPTFDESKLKMLAEETCYSLFFDQTDFKECMENFNNPKSKNGEIPPTTTVVCRENRQVTLKILPPSPFYQLVVLFPNNTKALFEYQTLKPNHTTTTITMGKFSYKVFATVLGPRGSTGFWRPGPVVDPWNIQKPTDTVRPIGLTQIGEFVYRDVGFKNVSVDATFMWESTDGYACNLEVTNMCKSTVQGDFKVFHIDARSENRTIVLEQLPIDDECRLQMRGPYSQGALIYHTPPCRNDQCVPHLLNNVNVTTSAAESGAGWDVTVYWDKPNYRPINYTIILRNDFELHLNLPGNASEATFPAVNGSGLFEVTVIAAYVQGTVVANRRGLFPYSGWAVSQGAVTAGAWSAVLMLAAAAVILVCLRRRIRNRRISFYFPDLEEKASKDYLEESSAQGLTTSEDGWEVRPDRLLLHEVLGEGAFGIVRKATITPGSKEVAVKMLKEFPSLEEIRSFRAEMELMKSVGAHPHVVSLVGCCSGRRPCIVAEYCSRGDLLNYLRCAWDVMVSKRNAKYYNNNIEYGTDYRYEFKSKNQAKLIVNKLYDLQGVCDTELTPVDLLSFCRQIAKGMEFLASNRVVHRDLAARNVLVCADKTLKVADFGLSRDVYQDNQYKQKGNGKLPIKWMALESLTRRLYTTQSDVWSFGVVMWEVVTVGGSPYPGVAAARLPRLLRAGYRMPKPYNCNQQLYEVMVSCWSARPRERPTFSELHVRLDTLLHNATAADYLTLQIEHDELPLTPKHNRYRALLSRNKLYRPFKRGNEVYEQPLKPTQSNHYTSSPDTLKSQVV